MVVVAGGGGCGCSCGCGLADGRGGGGGGWCSGCFFWVVGYIILLWCLYYFIVLKAKIDPLL